MAPPAPKLQLVPPQDMFVHVPIVIPLEKVGFPVIIIIPLPEVLIVPEKEVWY